jgi:hypothetical protein
MLMLCRLEAQDACMNMIVQAAAAAPRPASRPCNPRGASARQSFRRERNDLLRPRVYVLALQ